MRKFNLIVVCAMLGLLALMGCSGSSSSEADVKLGEDGYGMVTLPNGINVLVNQDKTTSLTAARVLIEGGVLTETDKNNGITNLMMNLLLKGNSKMGADQISQRLDFLGANVSTLCTKDYSALSFIALTENFEDVLDIISQSLMTPTFTEEELIKARHEAEGAIKSNNDSQSASSSDLFWKTAFGSQNYGLPYYGTEESIAGITASDIKAHYHNMVAGNNILVSITTDMDVDSALSMIEKYFADLPAGQKLNLATGLNLQSEKTGFIPFDRNQSFVYTGVILNHLEPRQVAYIVLLNEIMGNNVGSRLWFLRQKEKLAYNVFTTYDLFQNCATFKAGIGTDTAKVQQALSSLDREWTKMVNEGITAEELQDAKVNMKNNLIYRIDKKSSRANYMAYYQHIGYNYRFVLDLIDMADKITLQELNDFIKTEFTPERKFLSVVGKM